MELEKKKEKTIAQTCFARIQFHRIFGFYIETYRRKLSDKWIRKIQKTTSRASCKELLLIKKKEVGKKQKFQNSTFHSQIDLLHSTGKTHFLFELIKRNLFFHFFGFNFLSSFIFIDEQFFFCNITIFFIASWINKIFFYAKLKHFFLTIIILSND